MTVGGKMKDSSETRQRVTWVSISSEFNLFL